MKRACVAALAAVLSLSAIVAGGAAAADGRTITVDGTGIVTSVPDEAQFSFGVATTGGTAKAALASNALRMTKVIAAIKAQGIASADIQTAEISLSPNTNTNGTAILNYTASNSVTVNTKNISTSGAIVDAAIGAGANLAGGPSLTPSDQLLLNRRALKAAIADARGRAEAIATAARVKLGAVRTVTEDTSSSIVTPTAMAKAATPATTPVEAGTVQTEEDVTVTFAIA